MEPQKNVSYDGSFDLPETLSDIEKPMACAPNMTLCRVYSMGWAENNDPLNRSLSILLIQLTAFIIISRALYFILRPLRQPRIVCDFIGGVILGSSGLRMNTDFDQIIFPVKYALNVSTLSSYAVVNYIFLMAVKTDPLMMVRSGMKAVIVGTSSVLLPFAVIAVVCLYLRAFIATPIIQGNFMVFLGAILSITAFPVVGDILTELNLLNTEIGRLSLSSAVISDMFGWLAISAFTAINQNQRGHVVYAMLGMVIMVLFIVFVFGWAARWIVQKTPKGAQVHEGYLNAIMLSVIGVTLISDAIGASFMQGAVILGLMVPHGPPLGSALVERMELMTNEVLMPIFFFSLGNSIMIPKGNDWATICIPLIFVVSLGFVAKMAATILPACYCRIPLRKATMLALILNFRGVVELVILIYLDRGRLLDKPSFAVLVFMTMLTTAIAAPLVSIFYDPLASNTRALGRRTIQHLRENAEALILACVHNDDPVPAMINLLEASNAQGVSSMCVYVLHLVELVGRTSSTLIAHKNKKGYVNPSRMDRLLNQFINFEQDKHGMVSVLPYTTVAPYKSMHQDICSLAVEKKVVFILVPYPRKDAAAGATPADHAMRAIVIPEILTMAPCSVGILVHHGLCAPPLPPSSFCYDIGLLFWGGPHDREALVYASRMARHPGVTLKVTRIVPAVDMREDTERLLDDQVVEDFKISHCKPDKVTFKDEVALDIVETVSVLRMMVCMGHDLVIVGRMQGPNCYLNGGLAEWSDCPELGVAGDILASSDFKCPSLILIVQQQRQQHR